MIRIAIVTALPEEFRSVRRLLKDVKQEQHERGNVYDLGILDSQDAEAQILVLESGQGNVRAAIETDRMINHFHPHALFFVGIAGGIKDVRLGDVVVGTKVYGYDSGKDTDKGFMPRPDVARTSFFLEQSARALARNDVLPVRNGVSPPKIHLGAIAAGERVVAGNLTATSLFLGEHYSDALAVEMEGRGCLEAVWANPHIDAIIVRGISDLLDNKSVTDGQGFRELALENATETTRLLAEAFVRSALRPMQMVSFFDDSRSAAIEVEEVRVQLEICDAQGTVARYSRESTSRVIRGGSRYFVEEIVADGEVGDFRATPIDLELVFRRAGSYLLISRADRALRQNDMIARNISCTYHNSFTEENEYWTHAQPSPTRYLQMTFVFPLDRSPSSVECHEDLTDGQRVPRDVMRRALDDGRISVVITINNPKVSSKYRVDWRW